MPSPLESGIQLFIETIASKNLDLRAMPVKARQQVVPGIQGTGRLGRRSSFAVRESTPLPDPAENLLHRESLPNNRGLSQASTRRGRLITGHTTPRRNTHNKVVEKCHQQLQDGKEACQNRFDSSSSASTSPLALKRP